MVDNPYEQSIQTLLLKFSMRVPDIRVKGITLDSRNVAPGYTFIALKGHAVDGRQYIDAAIQAGASVVLREADESSEHGNIRQQGKALIVNIFGLPEIVSALAAAFYAYPANKLISCVAVTGTNGKTSVVQLVSQLKTLLGTRSAMIGTLGAGIYKLSGVKWLHKGSVNTTPDAVSMQQTLAYFAQHEVRQVAYEASSHALVQGRVARVKTDIAVFTNLTRDHLDYHGDMQTYGSAKRLLLKQPALRYVALNYDDAEAENWLNECPVGITTLGFGLAPQIPTDATAQSLPLTSPNSAVDRHCFATNVTYHAQGTSFKLDTSWGKGQVEVGLFGEFNVYNVLAATSVMLLQGEQLSNVIKALEKVTPVAGRMEVFAFKQHANVIIDYAHTPDALLKALQAVRLHCEGKVWCVFGCGGDRDHGKRPQMGAIAQEHADHVVITTDNSRTEEPATIAAMIVAGMKNADQIIQEPDRERALRYCLAHAAPEDTILMAGKGHEDYQIINNQTLPYDERAVVQRIREELEHA